MKKIVCGLVAFIIAATMIFGISTPITAMAIDNANAENGSGLSSEVPISERYHVIENGYRDKYDLQEGIFGFQSAQQVNRNAVYFYSDGYFEDLPEKYNPSLSTMSMALAFSAFNAKQYDFDYELPNGSYANLFRHVKSLISDIGIKEQDIFVNNGYAERPSQETVGMIMGAKKIEINNKDYILVPVAVRGGDYETEWASNVHLGKEGEAYGFSSAATQVVDQIESYISSSTSFDFASALNEGKVKFWVVGYSRGGAVANITAKRLTEKYGKTGNSIYGYTFEAPQGGVDSEEVKESWTYNGIYANIHNVINAGDLVTKIPPKQMGFKRYGVDHYNPGTEAGEIITSTYTTPSGVTVTSYADNTAYTVGDSNYDQRRPAMVDHLSAVDSTITFSDSFSIGRIDVLSALSGGEIFIPIEEGKNITLVEWLECFANDLQNWAANGTYSNGSLNNGGYNKDFRDFYTSNLEFSGEDHVTLETSLRCVLDLAYTHLYNEEFVYSVLYRLASILFEYFTIFDIYLNVIQNWENLSESKQDKYLDKIWNHLDGNMTYSDGTPVKKISEFVDESELDELKESVYTLSAFIFLFASKDHNTSPGFEVLNNKQIHIITFVGNVMTIIQGHFPEICLSWLTTYDENYSKNNQNSKFANREVYLTDDEINISPEVEAKIDIEGEKTTVSLSSIIKSTQGVDANSTDNGSAIYYAIYENGNMVGKWHLYRTPIVLDTSTDIEYSIKAFATRFQELSTELIITDNQLRGAPMPPNSDIEEAPTVIPEENSAQDDKTYTIAIALISLSVIMILIILYQRRRRKVNKK